MEIIKDKLYQFNGKLSNSYLYIRKSISSKNNNTRKEVLIFDLAYESEAELLGYVKKQFGLNVDIILATSTHSDMDHSGGLNALARETNCKVAIPYQEKNNLADVILNGKEIFTFSKTLLQESLKSRFWKMYLSKKRRQRKKKYDIVKVNDPSRFNDLFHIDADFILKNNDIMPFFNDWVCISTPGHSRDSMCYYNKNEKIMITGDTLLGSSKLNKAVLPSIYSNKDELIKSVDKINSFDIRYLCPGHGKVIS